MRDTPDLPGRFTKSYSGDNARTGRRGTLDALLRSRSGSACDLIDEDRPAPRLLLDGSESGALSANNNHVAAPSSTTN